MRRRGRERYPRCRSMLVAVAFLSGVSHTLLSTPGVRLPWFSVTRLTARALALNECVSSRCKALTLPHLPSLVACTIRAWSRLTFRWALAQSMLCQSTLLWGAAPAVVTAVICFASLVGLPRSLVPRDPEEVCSLARGVISTPIQTITAWHWLFPPSFTRNLVTGLRAYHVQPEKPHGLGPLYPPVVLAVHDRVS